MLFFTSTFYLLLSKIITSKEGTNQQCFLFFNLVRQKGFLFSIIIIFNNLTLAGSFKVYRMLGFYMPELGFRSFTQVLIVDLSLPVCGREGRCA